MHQSHLAQPSCYREWLYRYAAFCVGAVLFLICLGGEVTSKEAGMSVPDWPTSYGQNMFVYPWQAMTGGVFWEHSHRLVASGVGTLIILLAVGLCFQPRIWLRWVGLVAAFLVALQGLLGGLRVEEMNANWGIVHGMLAQALLVVVVFIALACTRWWMEAPPVASPLPWTRWTLVVSLLIFLQLGIGATMRHQHNGLAIKDFPLAYGQFWPKTDAVSLEAYNAERLANSEQPVTKMQIHLQMGHRMMAVLLVLAIFLTTWKILSSASTPSLVRNWAWAWAGLVTLQFILGMLTIWTNKAAEVATTHVAIGALTLVAGSLLTMMSWRLNTIPETAANL